LILEGDYYLATVLSASLTKLVIRFSEISSNTKASNSYRAEAMLVMSSIIRIGQSQFTKGQIDEDSIDRIMTCFRCLSEYKSIQDIQDVFLHETKSAYTALLKADDKIKQERAQAEKTKSAAQVDDGLSIRQLVKKNAEKAVDMASSIIFLAYFRTS
jgi:coatomer subunit beta